MFKISEFAKLFHIQPSVLRYYDKEGIFSPAYRNPKTGYRYYTTPQINSFSTLLTAKQGGIPLEKILMNSESTIQLPKDLSEIRRQHELFQFLLEDHANAQAPGDHYTFFIRTYPEFTAVKETHYMEGPRKPSEILTAPLQRLPKEGIELDYAHLSFVVFHKDHFSYTDNQVTLYLLVKNADHPRIVTIPRQRYICTNHYGSIETLGNAYKQLRRYVADRNLVITGPPSERYIQKTTDAPGGHKFFIELRLPLHTR